MEEDLQAKIKELSSEEATQIRKILKGRSKYIKKGVYREKENKVRFLNPDEWETIIYDIKDNLRKYYWFLLLTGMRYKEAKHVKKGHINWGNKSIIIFKPKGGVQRNANFSSFGKRKLQEMFSNLSEEDTLKFPTIQHLIQTLHKVCRKHKIKYWQDISVHNLRKQHENYLLALDLPYQKITVHMGHTAKTALEHYNSSEFIKEKKQLDKIRIWFADIFG
jgi:integrase